MKNNIHSKKMIKRVIQQFGKLGPLSSRSLFGGYGICHEKTMFALVADGILYLRADNELANEFVSLGMQRYIFNKRGLPLALNYYQVTELQWQHPQELMLLVMRALSAALLEKNQEDGVKKARLKDLPNISASLERLLWRIDISSYEQLCQCGALTAYLRLKKLSPDLQLSVLFSLAAAIEKCHVAVLSKNLKQSLLSQLGQHN